MEDIMKNYNKIMILSLFIISIICITGVSAADSNASSVDELSSVDQKNILAADDSSLDSNESGETNITPEINNGTSVNNDTPTSDENRTTFNTTTRIDVLNSSEAYESVNVTIEVISDDLIKVNNGNLTVFIKNGNKTVVNKTLNVVDGSASFLWTPSEVANYKITANYNGAKFENDEKLNITYESSGSEANYSSLINNNLNITVENITMYCRNGTRVIATVKNSKGEAVSNTTVIFNVCGVKYSYITDKNGQAGITINLNPGLYNIYTSVANSDLKVNSTVNVSNWNKSLIKIDVNNLVKEYKDAKRYTVNLTHNGTPIINQKITVTFGKAKYTLKTNNQGIASLAVNLVPGTYKFRATLDNYGVTAVKNTNVVVKKWNKNYVKLNTKSLTKNYQDNKKPFNATLTYRGKAVANEKIYFKIGNKNYKAVTNSKGVASLAVNQGIGKYSVTTSINSAGVKLSNKNTIKINKAFVDVGFDKNMRYDYQFKNNTLYITCLHQTKGSNIGIVFTYNKKPMAKKYVTIGVNSLNKYQGKITNKAGTVYYNTKNLKKGNNTFYITYYANSNNFYSFRCTYKIRID